MKHIKEEKIEVLEEENIKVEKDKEIKKESIKGKQNTRKIYFLILILLTFIFTTGSFTYALFTTSNIRNNAVSIKTGSLNLSITSADLNENNEITVAANEEKQITLTISNPNTTSVKYNLYYSANNDLTDVKIGYTDAGDAAPTTDGDVLAALNETGYTKKIRVSIQNNSTNAITFTFGVNVGLYNKALSFPEQKSALAKSDKTYTCKKATEDTLHTETCTYTEGTEYCYADGYYEGGTQNTTTITYGNISEIGTLTTGDAFDCDVDGNEEYSDSTERFYYVTDLDTNTAVLIYYNNVSEGVASNSTTYAYNTKWATAEYYGPETAKLQLPSTTQWSNVSLTNTTRDIIDQNGTTRVTGFSYDGYAARFLTYQEVETGCYDETTTINSTGGLSSKCRFLFENTKYSNSSIGSYGSWLETPHGIIPASYAWHTYSTSRRVVNSGITDYINTNQGVRPVIEVSKSNMLY